MKYVGNENLVEVLEVNHGDNSYFPIFDCTYTALNFSDVLFGFGGVLKDISCQVLYGLFKLHDHENNLYYHATSEIYFHNLFLIFTQLLICMGLYVFDHQNIYTT